MQSESALNPSGIAFFPEDHNLLVVSMTRPRLRSPHVKFVTGFKAGLDGNVLSHIGEIPNFVGEAKALLGIVAPSPLRSHIYLANHHAREVDGRYLRITKMGATHLRTHATMAQHAYALNSGSELLNGIVVVDEFGNGFALEQNRIYQIAIHGDCVHNTTQLRQTRFSIPKTLIHDLTSEPHNAGVTFTAMTRGPIHKERETILLAGVNGSARPVFRLYYWDLEATASQDHRESESD
ncbi:MAG: hypothetical protein ABL994_22300, partial [Verrucomicrobiales bacterium]